MIPEGALNLSLAWLIEIMHNSVVRISAPPRILGTTKKRASFLLNYIKCVYMSLVQSVGIMHNRCKVSNPGHHKKQLHQISF